MRLEGYNGFKSSLKEFLLICFSLSHNLLSNCPLTYRSLAEGTKLVQNPGALPRRFCFFNLILTKMWWKELVWLGLTAKPGTEQCPPLPNFSVQNHEVQVKNMNVGTEILSGLNLGQGLDICIFNKYIPFPSPIFWSRRSSTLGFEKHIKQWQSIYVQGTESRTPPPRHRPHRLPPPPTSTFTFGW